MENWYLWLLSLARVAGDKGFFFFFVAFFFFFWCTSQKGDFFQNGNLTPRRTPSV